MTNGRALAIALIDAAAKALGRESECDHSQVIFKGQQYCIVGGAICTHAQFEAFEDSFAHLMLDGRIMRYGNQIGTAEDLTYMATRGV